MGNMRFRILLFALIGIIALIAGLMAVQAEAASDSASGPSSVPAVQRQSVDQVKEYQIPTVDTPQDPCYDVSLSEVGECRIEMKGSSPSKDLSIEECFDVPLGERAKCGNEPWSAR